MGVNVGATVEKGVGSVGGVGCRDSGVGDDGTAGAKVENVVVSLWSASNLT